LTRGEEFSVGTLRPAAVIDVKAGATADGELTAWTFANINSGPAAITTPYRVANQRIDYQPAESPLTRGSFRALAPRPTTSPGSRTSTSWHTGSATIRSRSASPTWPTNGS